MPWGGPVRRGASCYPMLRSELRRAHPKLQSLLWNRHPYGNAKHRDLQLAIPGGFGSQSGKLDVLSCGSCSSRAEPEPREAQGWQDGFYPSYVILF